MSEKQTVTINGRLYDAVTGLPIKSVSVSTAAPIEPARVIRHAAEIHNFTQRSKTLNRTLTKKPEFKAQPTPAVHYSRERTVVPKSEAISKFAPHPRQAKRPELKVNRRAINDIAPVKHPSVARAEKIQAQKTVLASKAKPVIAPVAPKSAPAKPATPTHTPSQIIKNQAIDNALANAPTKKQQEATAKKSFWAR